MDDDCIFIDNGNDSNNDKNDGKYPSKLAELLAAKVKIKQEKNALLEKEQQNNNNHNNNNGYYHHPFPLNVHAQILQQQQRQGNDIDLIPRTIIDQQALGQLRLMGFNTNDGEVMIAIRAVQKKWRDRSTSNNNHHDSSMISVEALVEEAMLFIVTQREEQSEAQKIDQAREQSEIIAAEERTLHQSSLDEILRSASIDEIIGNDDGCENNIDSAVNSSTIINTSIYFPSSTLLTLAKVKRQFRILMNNHDTAACIKAKENIIKLLTLEKKAFKWFGAKIPYAYFGVTLADRIASWSTTSLPQLQIEIDHIEHAMYTLSEQEQGDLGLMIPRKFLEARAAATAQGIISNNDSEIIILDD